MPSDSPIDTTTEQLARAYSAADLAEILRERGWLDATEAAEQSAALCEWLASAAELLGPHAATREELAALLQLVFSYDAAEVLRRRESQEVLARSGAREVIRELANRVLDVGDLDSDCFKQVIEEMKSTVLYRSRAMFHPIRLALTGRAGEGELDRVILLIDSASRLKFAVPVKSVRQRILEFCVRLD